MKKPVEPLIPATLGILTDDSYLAAEVAKLKEEAEALAKIKESIGSEAFPELLFDKIYKTDIERLRSMESQWKTRTPPIVIEYATVAKAEETSNAEAAKPKLLKSDQEKWSLHENLVVYKDR